MIKEDDSLTKLSSDLPFPIEEYNMSLENKSSFLDIGSGFGKPVYHAAMQTACKSFGVEIVPARVAFCLDSKYEFIDEYQKKVEKNKPKGVWKNSRQRANATPTKA